MEANHAASLRAGLTRPEVEVLVAAADGLTAGETATLVLKSEATIRSHRRAVIAKLGAASIGEAISKAHRTGVLPS